MLFQENLRSGHLGSSLGYCTVSFILNIIFYRVHSTFSFSGSCLTLLLLFVIFAGIFERFRGILHEGEIDKRVQYLIENLFATRKAKFQVEWFESICLCDGNLYRNKTLRAYNLLFSCPFAGAPSCSSRTGPCRAGRPVDTWTFSWRGDRSRNYPWYVLSYDVNLFIALF